MPSSLAWPEASAWRVTTDRSLSLDGVDRRSLPTELRSRPGREHVRRVAGLWPTETDPDPRPEADGDGHPGPGIRGKPGPKQRRTPSSQWVREPARGLDRPVLLWNARFPLRPSEFAFALNRSGRILVTPGTAASRTFTAMGNQVEAGVWIRGSVGSPRGGYAQNRRTGILRIGTPRGTPK